MCVNKIWRILSRWWLGLAVFITRDAVSNTATKSTHLAAGATTFLGFNAEEWGIIGVVSGIIVSFGMGIFTVWFKMKYGRGSNKRDSE